METTTQQAPATTQKFDLREHVTQTIIAQLETGTIPWYKPWTGDNFNALQLPKNQVTGNAYRGINIVLLWASSLKHDFSTSEWASFKQWQTKKETIRKGEKGSLVVYYDTIEKETDGEIEKIPFLKSSYVFNRSQLASYKPEPASNPFHDDFIGKIDLVDEFVSNTKAVIEHGNTGAFYRPSTDKISMPLQENFQSTATCSATEGYYSTLLHELTHWTGHEKRIARNKGKKFGDRNYANEELVAEFGAAFMCAGFGIATLDKGDHAAYIGHWLEVLKNDKYCIFNAASEASKAVEYLNTMQPGN